MMEAEGAGSRVTLGAVPERRALNFHTPGPSARPEAAPLLQRGHASHEGWDEELFKSCMASVAAIHLDLVKSIPKGLKWDGKHETLRNVYDAFKEILEVRFGPQAVAALQGPEAHMLPDITRELYTAWSRELYLIFMNYVVDINEDDRLSL